MKRTKVMFMIDNLSGGGAEKVLSVIVRHLDKERFDVRVCCVYNDGVYVDEVKNHATFSSLLPSIKSKGWRRLFYRLKSRLIFSSLPPMWTYRLFVPKGNDVEVAFLEGLSTRILAYSTNRQAMKVAWVHSDQSVEHWTEMFYKNYEEERQAYQIFDRVVSVSRGVKSGIEQVFGPSAKNIVLHNPIESDVIKAQSRSYLPVAKDVQVRMVTVGRLHPQKAFERLLHIVNRLCKERYSVELWILGDGQDREALKAYIKAEQLEQAVKLWGFRDNPYSYMAQCDLFVCSSLCEGYSTAVAEALILGLPVVTTDCSGMDELLGNGEYGLITENSEEALEQGLRQILDMPGMLEEYRRKAVKRGTDFSLEALMKPIESLLLEKKETMEKEGTL
ncbi:MAG: glycosyltransferase [Mediterranea sp.]|jgi:glycosyltransferase involved in cell wall biosynthesis|nr:glycosyltransferase [Mediterranea sp.]